MPTLSCLMPHPSVMAAVSFPIYIRALINVLSGHEQKWHVTGSSGKRVSPFNFIVPQVLFFVFLLLTSIVGLVKDYGHETLTLATAWNVTNTVVLSVFIFAAFRESHVARVTPRPRPALYPTFARPVPSASVLAPITRTVDASSESEFGVPVFVESGRSSS